MAALSSIASLRFLPLPNPTYTLTKSKQLLYFPSSHTRISAIEAPKALPPATASTREENDAIPVHSVELAGQHGDIALQGRKGSEENESCLDEPNPSPNQIVGFALEGGVGGSGDGVGGGASFSSSSPSSSQLGDGEHGRLADRIINSSIVLVAGTFAITKLLTVDRDYWHGWTIYEILRYAPLHNWTAYEEALKTNPVFAKMMISGIVYSIGDWIAQCYAGKPLFDFDRARMFRSGLTGFALHGSLSHYYYEICESIFPFKDWWVVPAKVAFDQTIWSSIWNSIYFVILGFLRFESPTRIFGELKATFWPMLTAGWKLWPFAHLITYGAIPVEQRLLWVDCVELVWVMILSTYSNEKSEASHLEASPKRSGESETAAVEEFTK